MRSKIGIYNECTYLGLKRNRSTKSNVATQRKLGNEIREQLDLQNVAQQ